MTVQAVRVLLATAIIESSSSSLVTSPSSLSFSAWAKYLVIGRENIARNALALVRPGNYLNIDEFLLDLQQPRDLLLRLLEVPLQLSSPSRTNLSRANLTVCLADQRSPHLGDCR